MRQLLHMFLLFLVAGLFSTAAWAAALTQVTGASPFAGCTADDVAGQPGINFPDSEVEPAVVVNPTNRTTSSAAGNRTAGPTADPEGMWPA